MSDIQFKAGDVVRLKSGGPKMTVTQIGERALIGGLAVWCVWFDGQKKFEDTFTPEALEVADDSPRGNIRSSSF
jgi:uncharacterized protein YodC (DUF2158 family)